MCAMEIELNLLYFVLMEIDLNLLYFNVMFSAFCTVVCKADVVNDS